MGAAGSGKTEVGHLIINKLRDNFDSTNGVETYSFKTQKLSVNLTEIGGNSEMQKIWHHYYNKVCEMWWFR